MNRLKRILCLLLVVVLLSGMVPMRASASSDIIHGVAYVNAKKLHLRKSDSTSSKILDTAYTAEVVIVLSKHDDWYKVIFNKQKGYMHEDYLIVKTTADVELGYGKVDASSVNVRSGPGTSHSKVTKVSDGKKAYIIGVNDGWYKVIVNDEIGYIRSDYLDLTEIPYENRDSKNDPLFFRNGKSLGTKPSPEALKGEPVSDKNDKNESNKDKNNDKNTDKKDDKEETSNAPTISGVKYGIAFTTGSGLRLRSKASTSSDTLASASKGEVVLVISKDGEWCKVSYNNKVGYMHADYLKVQTEGNAELGYGKFNGSDVNVRSGAGTKHSSVTQGDKGEKAYVIGIKDGWYKIIFNGKIGYVRSDFLTLTEIPYENKASSKSPLFFRGGKSTGTEPSADALKGNSGSSNKNDKDTGNESSGSSLGQKIVSKAKQYLGVPYKWGGTSPSGFDCSGFVYYVLRSQGINASRTLAVMVKQGKEVSKSNLEPGDVVFFKNTYKSGISHVGIYVGGGQFIHAPSSGKVVSYADLHSAYYTSHYYTAVRFSK